MEEVAVQKSSVLEALRDSVINVFSTMAKTRVSYVKMEEKDRFSVSDDVAGLMVLMQQKQRRLVAVVANEKLARQIVARIIGMDTANVTENDLLDGFGEVVNMVVGGMKFRCSDAGFELSPPLSAAGGSYELDWKTDRPTTIITFEMDGENFKVMACI